MRALLFFILIIVIFVGIRFTLKRINQIKAENAESEEVEKESEPEPMVTCAECQLNLPKSEALMIQSTSPDEAVIYACSEAHLKQLEDKSAT